MKYYITIIIAIFINSSLFGIVNITGERESFQVMLKLELIRDDNSSVTLLDGTKYVELKADTNVTGIAASLNTVRPADGVYTKIIYTVYKYKHKLHINDGTTDYYTTDKIIAEGDSWALSSDINEYGYTITVPATPIKTEIVLAKPLELVSGSNASLVFVNKYDTGLGVDYNSTLDTATWISEPTVASSFLPAMPTKTLSFEIGYVGSGDEVRNKITLFLDNKGELLGGYMMKLSPAAFNGTYLTVGNRNGDDYILSFQDATDAADGVNGDDYYDVNITLDCTNSTYTNFTINVIVDNMNLGDVIGEQAIYRAVSLGDLTCSDVIVP